MCAKIDVETTYPFDVTWEEWLDLSEEERDTLSDRVGEMADLLIKGQFKEGKMWVMLYGEPEYVLGMVTATDWEDVWSSGKIEEFCKERNLTAYHFSRAIEMP